MASSHEILELHIIRHGKSSWDYERIGDIDRPLTERGIDNAYLMAQRFYSSYSMPDLMLTSPAIRAMHTAIIFARVLRVPFDRLSVHDTIFASGEKKVFDLISKTPPQVKRLMLFGHNPALTNLANMFLQKKIVNIPTVGIVTLQFNAPDWSEITPMNLTREYFDYPKRII